MPCTWIPIIKNVAAEINAPNLVLMKTMRGYIWLEEPHKYSYMLNISLQLISDQPMHDVNPNAVVNDWPEAVNDQFEGICDVKKPNGYLNVALVC